LKNDLSTQTSEQTPIEPPTPEAKAMIRAMEKAHKNQARESKDAVFMKVGRMYKTLVSRLGIEKFENVRVI